MKPRLVFFRRHRRDLPGFKLRHMAEQARCLAQFFEVCVVSDHCDYSEACERHRADIALFESGVDGVPQKITNTSACSAIPKIGFCNTDAFCPARSSVLADMDHWGVEALFTLSVAMPEYTPEIADELFVWPNFADTEVYRDYGQPKTVPVVFTGSRASFYPWRNAVYDALIARYPCLTVPHAGWSSNVTAARTMLHGEGYARLLAAAQVAPTCGSVAREVVRKHFEIPATGTCLVTERTPGLEAAGFVDMQNAVFADAEDVCDKLDHLFGHPEELQSITDAGRALVNSHHTIVQRDQIHQWFKLNSVRRSDQRITQDGPFGSLRLVSTTSGIVNSHVRSGGLDLELLHEGERLIGAGRYAHAARMFRRSLNYHFMAEALVGLARCSLYQGDAVAALEWLAQSLGWSLSEHQAREPDPVEWALFVRALLCAGRLGDAAARARQFPELHHHELERIRDATAALTQADALPWPHADRARSSLHVLPTLSVTDWTDELCRMLRSCNQERMAEVLANSVVTATPRLAARAPGGAVAEPARRPTLPLLERGSRTARAKRVVATAIEAQLRGRVGVQRFPIIWDLARQQEVRSALLFGASAAQGLTQAVMSGLGGNVYQPEVRWVRDATPRLFPRRYRPPGERVAGIDAAAGHASLGRAGLVLVGPAARLSVAERELVLSAEFVIVMDIDGHANHPLHTHLSSDPCASLLVHAASDHPSYSAFRLPRDD